MLYGASKSIPIFRTQDDLSTENLFRYRFVDASYLMSECGSVPQTMIYLILFPALPDPCTAEELMGATDSAVLVANFKAGTLVEKK